MRTSNSHQSFLNKYRNIFHCLCETACGNDQVEQVFHNPAHLSTKTDHF
jgi:hypothetical protein